MSEVTEIRVPDMGGAENVEVIELLVQAGDAVVQDQGLIAVETDKATMEIPAPADGVIKELKVEEGGKVSEGDLIGLLEVKAGHQTQELAKEKPVKEEAAKAEAKEKPEPTKAEPSPTTETPVTAAAPSPLPVEAGNRLPYASPSIRKLARELDVPLDAVSGTGDKGRITRADIHAYVKGVMSGRQQAPTDAQQSSGGGIPGILPWPKVDFEKFGPIERKALSRIRKISGANLHRNWVTIPHVTNHEDADITDLEAFRVQLNKDNEKEGIKVTLLALLIKAAVTALRKFPEFNSSLEGEELILKGYYHIGFAADTPNGLVVPVVRDADRKGILEIATEVRELAAKAREGKLGSAEMSGGCFSISSLGGIGGTYFTPIINAPEVAILGVSKARTQLLWNGEAAEPRLILPMSLSWDHRVVDGAMAGRFNACLASVLADFRRVLL